MRFESVLRQFVGFDRPCTRSMRKGTSETILLEQLK
jgi:hypothetical protein